MSKDPNNITTGQAFVNALESGGRLIKALLLLVIIGCVLYLLIGGLAHAV